VSRKAAAQQRLFKESVFRDIFETHFTRVVRYVQGQTGNLETSEDIAADVFRVAWQKLDPTHPFGLPWLIRTAMYKTRDHQRREYRGAAVMTALGQLVTTGEPGLNQLDKIALYEAMSRLSAKDLEIIRLTYWDGLSAGEVAEVLRMREGAIWTRLHRARAQLRSALADNAKAGSPHA
jgi:RNA polymerase sigma-70 factor, ECF subfamily